MIYCGEETDRLILNKLICYTGTESINPPAKTKKKERKDRQTNSGTSLSMRPPVRTSSVTWLRSGGRAGCRGLVVAAVHFLLHGAVVLQLLAGVVGDLQEAAGLHHHVGLAGVRQDGVLRNHLHVLVTWGCQSERCPRGLDTC